METVPLKTAYEIRYCVFSGKTYIVLLKTASGLYTAAVRNMDQITRPIEEGDYALLREKVEQASGLLLPPLADLFWITSCGMSFAYAAVRS